MKIKRLKIIKTAFRATKMFHEIAMPQFTKVELNIISKELPGNQIELLTFRVHINITKNSSMIKSKKVEKLKRSGKRRRQSV